MYHFIFDLDGTISNPEVGIFNGYRYTFQHLNIPIPSNDVMKTLIGPPLRIVFEQHYHLSTSEANFAIQTYRKYYNELGGAFENYLYKDMFDVLHQLHELKNTLHIATHKGNMAHEILKHFKIRDFFSQLQHYNEAKNITTKERMIELILQEENICNKNKVVMIGDRHSDIEAAHHHQIKSIAVLYGFGSNDELEKSNPTYVANNAKELLAILQQL